MWVVTENTPGYLPDSEPAGFKLKSEALRYAADLASDLREAGYRVTGSRGFYNAWDDSKIADLGRVVETVFVNEAYKDLVDWD